MRFYQKPLLGKGRWTQVLLKRDNIFEVAWIQTNLSKNKYVKIDKDIWQIIEIYSSKVELGDN